MITREKAREKYIFPEYATAYRTIAEEFVQPMEVKIPKPLKGYEGVKTYPDHNFTFNRNGKVYEIKARNLKLAKKKLDILLKKDAK